jgi:hypothetical protein
MESTSASARTPNAVEDRTYVPTKKIGATARTQNVVEGRIYAPTENNGAVARTPPAEEDKTFAHTVSFGPSVGFAMVAHTVCLSNIANCAEETFCAATAISG